MAGADVSVAVAHSSVQLLKMYMGKQLGQWAVGHTGTKTGWAATACGPGSPSPPPRGSLIISVLQISFSLPHLDGNQDLHWCPAMVVVHHGRLEFTVNGLCYSTGCLLASKKSTSRMTLFIHTAVLPLENHSPCSPKGRAGLGSQTKPPLIIWATQSIPGYSSKPLCMYT